MSVTSVNTTWIRLLPPFLRSRLEGRMNRQKIVANVGWLFADRALRMAVGVIVSVWLARYLGATEFGLYSYALAFVALFSAFANLGLDGIVVRNIVRDPQARDEILGSAFALKLIGGVLTLLIASTAIYWLHPQDHLTRWLVAIIAAGTIFQAFETVDLWFQSQVKSKYSICARDSALLLVALAKISMILYGAPLIAFAWAGLLETVISASALLAAYRLSGALFTRWKTNFARAKELLRDSWPLMFSSIAVLMNLQVDKVMLGEISGDRAVGLYSAACKLSEIWYFVPIVVGLSVMQSLIVEKQKGERFYRLKLQQVYDLMTISALLVVLPMTFLAEEITQLIYGAEYSGTGHILSVHIWSIIFIFHVSIRTRSLVIEGLQRFVALFACTTMILNVLLNIVLIPTYGAIGAAYASLASWIAGAMILPLCSKKTAESVPMFLCSLVLKSLRRGT